MKTSILKTFTVVIPLVGLVLTSQAQITNNVAVAPQLLTTTDTPQSLPAFSVPQFNTALGTLNSVQLTLTPDLTGSGVQIYNPNNSVGTLFTAGYFADSTGGYSGTVSIASIAGLSGSWMTGTYTQQFALAAPPSFTTYVLSGLTVPGSGSPVTLTEASVTPFEGVGNYSLVDTAGASWDAITTGPISDFVGAYCMAGGSLNVVYNYTAVPEPSTIGLVVVGLQGALGIRRRKA